MFGACSDIFTRARDSGVTCVLNFVNSHPAYHNRILCELAGLPRNHPEMVPASTRDAVERELALADLVLVPSTFVARQLHDMDVTPGKVSVHPYGVDRQVFASRDPISSIEPPGIHVVFFGQLSYRKGLATLLDAASFLIGEDISFSLIGPTVSPEAFAAIPGNVTVRPAISHSEAAAALSEADIFVMPSLEDAYCLAVVEAMAVGLPVIVTDHVGAAELVAATDAGDVVPAADAHALATAIRGLAYDAERREAAGRRAREAVVAGPSWEDYAARVASDIDRLIRG